MAFQHKSLHPNVPGFVLKIMLGELSVLALSDQSMSAQKLQQAGYIFKYPTLSAAVNNLFKKS
jgi:NAD dependent epimerase/dehydratase family enzyme